MVTHKACRQNAAPESVLFAEGQIDEVFYYQALARHLNLSFLRGAARLAPQMTYPNVLYDGFAALDGGGEESLGVPTSLTACYLAAPRGEILRTLLEAGPRQIAGSNRLILTTPAHFSYLVRKAATLRIKLDASCGLFEFDASLSARTALIGPQSALQLLASPAVAGVLGLQLAEFVFFGALVLAILFFGMLVLRLAAGAASLGPRSLWRPHVRDATLPLYSIVVALHREARIVPQLVDALERIDYPRAKLEVKLVIEADDRETLEALRKARLSPLYEIIVAPSGWPRTKPRALNVALPLLRGTFVTVFDAEDEPDPLQLRHAAEYFLASPKTLACLQARLVIDNVEDSWLTRLFSIEYAVLFDVLLEGMSELRLPLPLGGSSNHFRADVLRAVHGWDAWNVTEDADLGMRLARNGYRTATLASQTLEEAPARLDAWFSQRRRWLKGWMQTGGVLLRDPRRLLAETGMKQGGALLLLLVGLVLAPLLWPILTGVTLYQWMSGGLPEPTNWLGIFAATLFLAVSLLGVGSTLWLSWLGMRRRNLLNLWLFLPLILPYYLLISCAAWAALYDLLVRPFHWRKTEHGLARTRASRRAPVEKKPRETETSAGADTDESWRSAHPRPESLLPLAVGI
ncbi:glycosyltransferase [Beijerinckia indica]|nr:glycosyltransferase [Beijerinckia indica]